ncbi:MAG: hypothetical protein OFPI_40150 [Osedax symbiont Rs2]|nr:MAG: hypothetical protein OFPI_40150 [Osedax symbiont Rs2]
MLTKISSTQMPIERFQQLLSETCGEFQANPARGKSMLEGRVFQDRIAGLEIAHVANKLQSILRTDKEIRKDSGENFFLITQEEGRALMMQNETAHMLMPGDMILIDSSVPSEFIFFGEFSRQLSVHLPRVEMQQRFSNNVRGGMYLPRTDYATASLYGVLAKACSAPADAKLSGFLREALFSLLGAVILEQSSASNGREFEGDISGAQLLERGLSYIDSQFKTSDLTIQTVADDLCVSMRQLQRAFSLLGTTPTAHLLRRRLEHACQLLLQRSSGMQSSILVSSIAYDSGFNDVSYFNRQFRRCFECSPGQYKGN